MRRFHYAYLIVASCIVITFVPCAMVLSCAGIFFTPVSSYLGVPTGTFSLYFSIVNLALTLILPVGGTLLARLGARALFSACVAIDGVTLIAMSFFTEVWQFYVAGVFLGVGVGPLVWLAVPTLVNAWCVKRVGFFVGLCMAFTGIGGVVFNPVGTALIGMGPEGWRLGYLVFGIVILVAALPVTLLIIRSNPAEKGLAPYGAEAPAPAFADAARQTAAKGASAASAAGDSPAETGGGSPAPAAWGVPAKRAMRMPVFFAIAAFGFLINVNQMAYQFFPSYCQSFADTMPGIAALAGVVASACMGGQAIGKVILGALNDRSPRAGLVLGIAAGAAGIAAMWAFPGAAPLLLGGSFLFGLVYACTTVETPLVTRTVFGSRDYARIYAPISMAAAAGGIVATAVYGFVIDLPGGFAAMFTMNFVCMAACAVLGLAALRRGKKLHEQEL